MSSYQRGVHKTDISKSDLLALSKTLKTLHKIKANCKPFSISLFFKKNCKKFDKKTKLALLAIKKYSKDLVLCHNDLNPQNILFSERVKFIDWEFASINDRYFDITSVIVEFNLNRAKEKYFLHSYFKTKHIDTKRLKAYKILYKHLCKIWFDIIPQKRIFMPKTVLITGATSGFGKECAKIFAENGNRVIATGRRAHKLKELKEELRSYDILTLQFDVSDRDAVFENIAFLPPQYKDIDILINSAGLALGLEPSPDALLDDWEEMIDTNIKGLLYVTKAVLPIMIKQKKGYIFNLGSIAERWPYQGGNVYGATKAFVEQFSYNLRTDLRGTNIRVSNIEPGAAKTEFSEIRFKGEIDKANKVYDGYEPLVAEDIANLIFTLSNLPAHVNVNSLEVMPTAQTWAGLHVEKG